MIAALVLNAAPNPSQSMRRRRGARGLLLWGTLLSVIPEYEGAKLERTSIRWPVALRRRFLSGLYYRTATTLAVHTVSGGDAITQARGTR
jgi:hypothetical protein